MNLWEKFATYDNFLLAWQRTVNVTSRMIHDELGMRNFGYNLQASLEHLVDLVKANDFPYEPLPDHKVYIPKPSSTLRTMSLMTISDVVVYQALANVVADIVHPRMVSHEHQHVLGNLYAGPDSGWMLRPWRYQYNRYVGRIEQLFKAGNRWIASTDIVSFYDTIDHLRLMDIINRFCGKDEKFANLLHTCLTTWAAHNANDTMSRGIPQGSNASDFLANLFLYEIDQLMIANGYHYVRYVDDVRILGKNKSVVQKGLIQFDLELKRAGLAAQVTKTTVHEIKDIDQEISRLSFLITDLSGQRHSRLIDLPSPPTSEQAGSMTEYVKNSITQTIEPQLDQSLQGADSINTGDVQHFYVNGSDVDESIVPDLQLQLRTTFHESFDMLTDPVRGKEAESSIVYCLYRLDPDKSVRDKVIKLLPQVPWRSDPITKYLSRFKNDKTVINALTKFLSKHQVYTWHQTNVLRALYQVSGAYHVADLCREWLTMREFDWYAKTHAARILAEVPGQHAFLLECFQRLQLEAEGNAEETAILRQELGHAAFQQIRSPKKQLTLLNTISNDPSLIVRRLPVYLIQQASCVINWDDLQHDTPSPPQLAGLVEKLGLSSNAPKPCLIAQTMQGMYDVDLSDSDLRKYYRGHYDRCLNELRKSVAFFYESSDDYVSTLHQFAHLTLIAFFEYVLPDQSGIYEGYAALTDRKAFTELAPRGANTWKLFGSLRNRVDHPVDRKTQAHSQRIDRKEADMLCKELKVAYQELFDCWLAAPLPDSVEFSEEADTLGSDVAVAE